MNVTDFNKLQARLVGLANQLPTHRPNYLTVPEEVVIVIQGTNQYYETYFQVFDEGGMIHPTAVYKKAARIMLPGDTIKVIADPHRCSFNKNRLRKFRITNENGKAVIVRIE